MIDNLRKTAISPSEIKKNEKNAEFKNISAKTEQKLKANLTRIAS